MHMKMSDMPLLIYYILVAKKVTMTWRNTTLLASYKLVNV